MQSNQEETRAPDDPTERRRATSRISKAKAPALDAGRATRKNIYIKAEDAEMWERAESLAGESLSQLLSDLLRQYVVDRETQGDGFDKIIVEAISAKTGQVRLVTFYGRWLTPRQWDGDMLFYRVALTRRGRIAATVEDQAWGDYDERGISLGQPPHLKVYDSLKAAVEDDLPTSIINAAAVALNAAPVEVLDI
jgi:hypothetical protein